MFLQWHLFLSDATKVHKASKPSNIIHPLSPTSARLVSGPLEQTPPFIEWTPTWFVAIQPDGKEKVPIKLLKKQNTSEDQKRTVIATATRSMLVSTVSKGSLRLLAAVKDVAVNALSSNEGCEPCLAGKVDSTPCSSTSIVFIKQHHRWLWCMMMHDAADESAKARLKAARRLPS